jgi:peptide/nickel transport system substrate-binding protein
MSVVDRATKLRIRRILRRRQRQVEAATEAAENQFDTNLVGRFDRLLHVRRFVFTWVSLLALMTFATILQTVSLSGYYQTLRPVPGGIYHEGIVGTYSNANPIFATGAVDTAVSKLIFAGLLKYDEQNKLSGDLATGYTVDSSGRHYVVHLRPHLTWQDGKPLTAQDVAFTYRLIQNPDAQSPLRTSWQGIQVSALDNKTVKFDLPNVLSAFPASLTNGIVPEHILSSIPATQLRSADFNTIKPVGAGPFEWQALQSSATSDPDKAISLIGLQPFSDYYGGKPQLGGFVLHAYGNSQQMVTDFQKRILNAVAGLQSVPTALAHAIGVNINNFPSTAAEMTFFKTTSGVLADTQVRQALIQGADTKNIIDRLGYATRSVREPLLSGQLGYDAKYQQATYNIATANTTLDKAGWVRGSDGIRSKAGQPLLFRLYAENTPENSSTVQTLVHDWRKLGVKAVPVLQQLSDFQTTLEFHTYDALLYGISIGSDPDVYAYWDSTQADIRSSNRLNFSEYKSTTADTALEAGRTRIDPTLRIIKYRPFLQAWQSDAPALGLYQPRFLYITRGTIYGLKDHVLNTDADRYGSVAEWKIHTARITN